MLNTVEMERRATEKSGYLHRSSAAAVAGALVLASVVLADNRGVLSVAGHSSSEDELPLYEASYALVIGVADHTGGWRDLPGVKTDIKAVSEILKVHGFKVAAPLMNPDYHRLDQALRQFISRRGQGGQDRILIYFAGHGYTKKESEIGYIVPADAPDPRTNLPGFLEKAFPMDRFNTLAKEIEAKHALFVFDSCFSGSIFAPWRGAVSRTISYKTSQLVRQFITSGSADEEVPDESIFRRQFVLALEGEADVNRDGYVTGTELGEFLQEKVIKYSNETQHPQYGKIRDPRLDKGDFVFRLSLGHERPSSGHERPSAPEPPPSTEDRSPDRIRALRAFKGAVDSWCGAESCGFRVVLASESGGDIQVPTLVLADVITGIGSVKNARARRVTLNFVCRLSTRPTASTIDLVYVMAVYEGSDLTNKLALEQAAINFYSLKEKTFNSILIDGLKNIKREVAAAGGAPDP